MPTLFVQASLDIVLKPEMAKNMEAFVPQLTRGEVKAGHWAMVQTPVEVNTIIGEWLEGQGIGKRSSSSL
jgi:soluble epoxide hydrolase/lipid-phosphate phosphatase